jgi:hypothetical protein
MRREAHPATADEGLAHAGRCSTLDGLRDGATRIASERIANGAATSWTSSTPSLITADVRLASGPTRPSWNRCGVVISSVGARSTSHATPTCSWNSPRPLDIENTRAILRVGALRPLTIRHSSGPGCAMRLCLGGSHPSEGPRGRSDSHDPPASPCRATSEHERFDSFSGSTIFAGEAARLSAVATVAR